MQSKTAGVAMYFVWGFLGGVGVGVFFSFICFGTLLSVTRGEKQGSRLFITEV